MREKEIFKAKERGKERYREGKREREIHGMSEKEIFKGKKERGKERERERYGAGGINEEPEYKETSK